MADLGQHIGAEKLCSQWRLEVQAIADVQRMPFPMRAIVLEIAAKYSVSVTQLRGHNGGRRLALPRREAFYRCHHELCKSYSEIGRYFGDRDFSTIGCAVRKFGREAQ
jgi:chromosomal replication initiation ATPase DnaA